MTRFINASKYLNKSKDKRSSGIFSKVTKEGGSYEHSLIKAITSLSKTDYAAFTSSEGIYFTFSQKPCV